VRSSIGLTYRHEHTTEFKFGTYDLVYYDLSLVVQAIFRFWLPWSYKGLLNSREIEVDKSRAILFTDRMGDTAMVTEKTLPAFAGTGSGSDAAAGISTGSRAGRRDGRGPGTLRNITSTQGDLLRADGSARVRIGLTDVLAAVYGPMDCPVNRQLIDRADVHVSFRQRASSSVTNVLPSRKSVAGEVVAARDLREIILQSVLGSLHPRKAVALTVHVLSDDGGVAAAAINASYLALIDAGVDLLSISTAACVSINNGAITVDPDGIEEAEADGVLTLTYETRAGKSADVVACDCQGDVGDYSNFQRAVSTARGISDDIRTFIQLAVQGRVQASQPS
jgi:ribonuclease PH